MASRCSQREMLSRDSRDVEWSGGLFDLLFEISSDDGTLGLSYCFLLIPLVVYYRGNTRLIERRRLHR